MNKNNINEDDDETYTALDATKIGKDESNYEALTLPGARKVSLRKCRYTSSKSGIRSRGRQSWTWFCSQMEDFFSHSYSFWWNFSALFDTYRQLLIIPFFCRQLGASSSECFRAFWLHEKFWRREHACYSSIDCWTTSLLGFNTWKTNHIQSFKTMVFILESIHCWCLQREDAAKWE